MTRERGTVGWVVDAQVDFMRPDGRLYVKDLQDDADPGAAEVVGALERAVAWMREHARALVFTGDWHDYGDPEIDPDDPDPGAGTYPPHCMGRADDPEERRGAEIIPEIRPRNPVVLDLEATAADAADVARAAVDIGRPVFVRKTRFDVFAGNEATEAFLEALERELGAPLRFVVAGVARDVCVTQAVDGMLARGHAVTALTDATWGLGLEAEAETVARWAAAGATLTTVGDLVDG